MRAVHNQGVHIRLNSEDRPVLEEGRRELSCMLESPFDHIELTLRIVDKVHNSFLEDPGFHLTFKTQRVSVRKIEGSVWDRIKSIYIQFSTERFKELINNYQNEREGSWFQSRGELDRHSISYFE